MVSVWLVLSFLACSLNVDDDDDDDDDDEKLVSSDLMSCGS